MLEKPDLQGETIAACVQKAYGLNAAVIEFLPLGADRNTAVYRAVTHDGTAYFVKLRSGIFDEMTIVIPRLFYERGIQQVIAPLFTRTQQLWTALDNFILTVSPFVEGRNGYEMNLSDQHWVALGRALKAIHRASVPPAVADRIQRETYSAHWREVVKKFQALVEQTTFDDPVSAKLAALMRQERQTISELVRRAEHYAAMLQKQSQQFILCHADIHAGNVLIDPNDYLYVVDWDTLIFAPKERDLMFVGGGQFGSARSPLEEETLFYQGYGSTRADPIGLAYYRCERIVQDIAAYCEQILLTDTGSPDREEGLRQLASQFLPDGVVNVTFQYEQNLPPQYRSQ